MRRTFRRYSDLLSGLAWAVMVFGWLYNDVVAWWVWVAYGVYVTVTVVGGLLRVIR